MKKPKYPTLACMNTGLEPQVRELTIRECYLLAKEGNLDPLERTELAWPQKLGSAPAESFPDVKILIDEVFS